MLSKHKWNKIEGVRYSYSSIQRCSRSEIQKKNETKFKYNRNRNTNRPCLPSGLTYNVTTVKCCMVCYRSQVRILLGTMISITLSQRRLFAIQIVGRWVAVVPLSILNLGMRKPNWQSYSNQSGLTTQIRTHPRATQQARVKCRCHVTIAGVLTQEAIPEGGG